MKFTPGEINIICCDAAKSLRFYQEVLGFAVTIDEEGFYHLRCAGNQYLLLPLAKSVPPTTEYGKVPQFSVDLLVKDIRAAYTYFKENGVPFAEEWQEGAVMFVVRDPDGLPWEVIQQDI